MFDNDSKKTFLIFLTISNEFLLDSEKTHDNLEFYAMSNEIEFL